MKGTLLSLLQSLSPSWSSESRSSHGRAPMSSAWCLGAVTWPVPKAVKKASCLQVTKDSDYLTVRRRGK